MADKDRFKQSDPHVLEHAIDAVARRILAVAAEQAEWGDYPEIGEDDWERVCDRLDESVRDPDIDEFDTAYTLLESRANQESL